MSPVFSEGSGAGGGREKAARERRVVCLKRGTNGENLFIMMIPSAMKASGTALGPGRAHGRRAGAPTGRMTALPTKKQAEKKFFFAVDDRCLIICQIAEGLPHLIQ